MTSETTIRSGVTLLLAIAALAAVELATSARRIDPCRDPERQQSLAGLPPGVELKPRANLDPDGVFFELSGNLAVDPDYTIFTISRTFDIPTAVSSGAQVLGIPMDPHDRWLELIEVDGEQIPVSWSRETLSDSTHLAGEIVFLGRQAVRSVLGSQIAASFDQLIHGTPALTYYVFEIVGPTSELPAKTPVAREWLVAAGRHFRAACGPE